MTKTAISRILTACGVEHYDGGQNYLIVAIPGDIRIKRPDRMITMYPSSWTLRLLRLWLESIRVIMTLPATVPLNIREEE